MNIGIIYYSQTGHTAFVAKQLAGALENASHQVQSIRLETTKPLQRSARYAAIKETPSVESFDRLIIGTPVHGGLISAPVVTFINSIPSFNGKKVSFLLTHFLPRQWGAVQTIESLEKLCGEKDAILQGSGDVTWFSIGRRKEIRSVVARLSESNLN